MMNKIPDIASLKLRKNVSSNSSMVSLSTCTVEPVISRLVSDYGLTVNITAAILGANAVGDGWFELELQGTDTQIPSGLTYLEDLELEVWDDTKVSNW